MSLDRFQDLSGISSSKSHDQYGQTPGIMRVLFGMGKRFPVQFIDREVTFSRLFWDNLVHVSYTKYIYMTVRNSVCMWSTPARTVY